MLCCQPVWRVLCLGILHVVREELSGVQAMMFDQKMGDQWTTHGVNAMGIHFLHAERILVGVIAGGFHEDLQAAM